MSIVKKGSRKIIVEGREYRWTIRKSPSYGQAIDESNLTLAAELFEEPGSTLVVTFPFARPDSWISSGKRSVKPSDVEQSIKLALENGWLPDLDGKSFQLRFNPKGDT